MASNRHAPEGTYDPYREDEESGRYGAYGSYGDDGAHHPHHQTSGGFGSYEQAAEYDPFDPYGRYDAYASKLTEAYPTYGDGTYGDGTDGSGPYGGGVYGHGSGEHYATEASYAAPYANEPYTGDSYAADSYAPDSYAAEPYATQEFQQPEFGVYDFGAGQVPPVPGAFEEEWNPTEESVRSVRGRHKLTKQRGGSMARSSTVLGVGMIAAVGAGGIATAQEKPATSISMPDVSAAANKAKDLPGVKLLSGGSDEVAAGQPLTQGALTKGDTDAGRTDAGEALRSRILQQAQTQQSAAEDSARAKAADKAAEAARAKAAKAQDKAEAAQRKKAEDARLAKLAKSFKLPVSGYQLTSGFGESGSLWSNGHTGLDFAASSGTPIRAVHSGTVTSAGWAGSYGYRTIVKMDDGTELWFCHQSSMDVSSGQKVRTGEVIGRVGSTGNVTGAHLHLEVRPGGGSPIDPAAWLRGKGLTP